MSDEDAILGVHDDGGHDLSTSGWNESSPGDVAGQSWWREVDTVTSMLRRTWSHTDPTHRGAAPDGDSLSTTGLGPVMVVEGDGRGDGSEVGSAVGGRVAGARRQRPRRRRRRHLPTTALRHQPLRRQPDAARHPSSVWIASIVVNTIARSGLEATERGMGLLLVYSAVEVNVDHPLSSSAQTPLLRFVVR